ncbi:MAG: hypothetical protein D6797_08055, partial [Bdellovibrio sp.]
TIGIVHDFEKYPLGCTGVLVGPHHVLTSYHCLLVGSEDDPYKVDGVRETHYFTLTTTKYPHLKKTYKVIKTITLEPLDFYLNEKKKWSRKGSYKDLAMLILPEDVGNKVGYLGKYIGGQKFKGFRGTLPQTPDPFADHFCDNNKYDIDELMHDMMLIDPFYYKNPYSPPQTTELWANWGYSELDSTICQAGYPMDWFQGPDSAPIWKKKFILVAQNNCNVKGFRLKAPVHNCSTLPGASGSPLFFKEGKEYYLVAIHSSSSTTQEEIEKEEPRKERIYFSPDWHNAGALIDILYAQKQLDPQTSEPCATSQCLNFYKKIYKHNKKYIDF